MRLRFFTLSMLLPILIAVLLLMATQRLQWRKDLTVDKLYSLNDATIKVLDGLEDDVTFEVFFSSNMPPRFQPIAAFVRDQLEEYRIHGKGKVNVVYGDPDLDPDLVARANQMGIFETRANLVSQNNVQAVRLWFGIAVLQGQAFEVFPSVQAIENLEYDFTGALVRLTRKEKPRLLMVGPTYEEGNGVIFDIRNDIKPIYTELSRNFTVGQVRLTQESQLKLDDIDGLILWSLHHFTEEQLYALDQYIVRGGPVMLLASGMRVDPNVLLAQPVPFSRADDFYAHLGFMVNRDLVCDQTCTKIKYTDVRPPVLSPYPLFPTLSHQTSGLDKEHETTADLKKLVIPWASSLSRTEGEGYGRVIARTSEQAWLQKDNFIIEPGGVPGPTSFQRYDLGMAFNRKYQSFFEEPPQGVDGSNHLRKGERPATVLVWSSEHLLTQTRDTSVLVWASSTASFLTLRDDLSGINRRENAFRPIRPLEPTQQRRFQWLSVLPVPILLLLLAVARGLWRRHRSVDYLDL